MQGTLMLRAVNAAHVRRSDPRRRRARARAAVLAVSVLAVLASALPGMARATAAAGPKATLEQCLTATNQSERAATFAGEMSSVAGSARMEIRIDVIERIPGEDSYHVVAAPGLGVWRISAPGVKVFKYLKQVTNLSAPAYYRGAVRFRWLGARGRTIASAQLRTRRCEQPVLTADEAAPTPPPAL